MNAPELLPSSRIHEFGQCRPDACVAPLLETRRPVGADKEDLTKPTFLPRKDTAVKTMLFALAFVAAATGGAFANEPPIQGPADAACRQQARAQVFTTPNPNHLSLWDLGSQIWHICMAAYHGTGPNPDRREQRF
jgi:hypothetical protein